ncbi:MAG: response regulator [Rickettsiales bacterium]|nr:response regulator [Rickettsiales bacterium]
MENIENLESKKILLVDDEELNLDILQEYLTEEGYQTILAHNGLEGLERLAENPDVSAIILDRMMPAMDGITFMYEIRKNPKFSDLPVVMQTAATSPEQVREGIEAGVFYYLAKPYSKTLLVSILKSALEHNNKFKNFKTEYESQKRALGLLESAVFKFQNLEQARNLSILASGFMPDAEKSLFGLHELTVNAIEHGNLGITYSQKKELLEKGLWRDEIDRLCNSQENLSKFAELHINSNNEFIEIKIKDCGTGFDYKKYLEVDSTRMTDPNGRGIAITKMYAFDEMEYLGSGNIVRCKVIKK